MTARARFGVAALGAMLGCATPAASTGPANVSMQRPPTSAPTEVTLRPFGVIKTEDGVIVLMDHNNGDKRVHVMTISRDFHGTKVSWNDVSGPPTEMRTDSFPISEDERGYIRSWSEQLWQLAPAGRRSFG